MRHNVQFLHGRYKAKMVIKIPKKNIITVGHKHGVGKGKGELTGARGRIPFPPYSPSLPSVSFPSNICHACYVYFEYWVPLRNNQSVERRWNREETFLNQTNREPKQRRRRAQRERQKVVGLQLCTCITPFCTFLSRRRTTATWHFLISRARFME